MKTHMTLSSSSCTAAPRMLTTTPFVLQISEITGRFTLEQAVTMEQILEFAKEHDPAELLMPVDAAFRQYKSIFLSPKQSKMFLDGIRLDTNRIKIPAEGDTVRVYGDGRFLALAHIERGIAELQIIKLFYTKENPNC